MSYDLSRFVEAQKYSYEQALAEVRNGRKTSHWIWYIFPQIQGLGRSYNCHLYGVKGLGEAAAFLEDPYLGKNLREITQAALDLPGNDAHAVFGSPDDMKLRSCMTLFSMATEDNQLFLDVLEKYYHGKKDPATIQLLREMNWEE